jgi:hypothetical protein
MRILLIAVAALVALHAALAVAQQPPVRAPASVLSEHHIER